MTGKELFGAAVRALGIYFLVHGLTSLPSGLFPYEGYSPLAYILPGVTEMIVGAVLMFKADGFVETCYSRTDSEGYPQV